MCSSFLTAFRLLFRAHSGVGAALVGVRGVWVEQWERFAGRCSLLGIVGSLASAHALHCGTDDGNEDDQH